ncbi:MAG: ribonuclease [Thermoleophilaceae bacterium]|jgi:ribonuclease R|nr:ribonuclease [Thermoleophilaceae bacterium]
MTPRDAPHVAVLGKRGRFTVAEPVFERGRQITLDGGRRPGASVGDLVLLGWGKRGPRVVRSIGRPDVARDVLEGLMLERGLRRSFPRAAEDEASDAARMPPVERPRRDLTELATFTIDPVTARDYDDAISARREGDASRLWVHIADVSAYVRPGSPLEGEAYRRATSVYVPGAVEPMLPHALSSDACSLVPGVDRLAVTVEMLMRGADVESVAFHRSLIRSDARLTYEQVDGVYAGGERAEDPWGEPLAVARKVAAALRDRRARAGSLEVESSEPVFDFDEDGHVVAVRREEQTESHSTIEQLMVLANEQVAGWLAAQKKPTLYRVHERPDPQAVQFLVERLESLGVATPPLPESLSPQQAADAMGEISRMVAAHVRRAGHGQAALTSLVLRSLKQAYYSPRNVGHAGLASPNYLHFTSPIRRYPDLVAHRALMSGLGLDDVAPRASDLSDAGEHSSAMEREAMQIERDADDVCMAFFLDRRLHEGGWDAAFEGEVVGLVGGGAFVRFGDEGFEGFLPARTLRGEWWDLNEQGTALVGERTGKTVRLGDPVDVSVRRVDAPRGRVDLVPAMMEPSDG